MENFEENKNKKEVLDDIYQSDIKEEKVEIFPKLKKRLKEFWHSKNGISYLVVALGGIAIIFGFWNSKVNIRGNFLSIPENGSNEISLDTGLNQQNLSELSFKDTDSDGLSDYDELYIFFTSPYLEDTDSDGISDKDEIAGGADPNCVGTSCQETERPYKPQVIQQQPTTIQGLLEQETVNINEIENAQNQAVDAISNLTADELRQLLREEGAPEDLLQGVSDEQLLQMAQGALQQQGL